MVANIERRRAALGIIIRMLIGAVKVGGLWHAETRAILCDMMREEWADGNVAGEEGK